MTEQQPNPNTPSWPTIQPPQPPVGWGAPTPQPPKKKHRARNITLGVVGAIVVISIISAATGGGKKGGNQAAAAPAVTATTDQPAADPATAVAAPAPKKTHKAAPKPVAKTVLVESGSGIKTTARFHVSGDWDLKYTYNCASFGMQGNFIVTTGGTDFPLPLANELGKRGSVTTHQHDGGSLYLEVNSECSWTLKVIDIP
jgi:hypothetical protein